MSVQWTLECDGVRRSLTAWGISSPQLEFMSLDSDILTFEVAASDISAEPPFAYGARIDLYCDSVRWFTGTVKELPASLSANRDSNRFVIANPWFDLNRVIFQDDRYVQIDPDNAEAGTFKTNNTSVVLFQTLAGVLRTNGAQISRALQYANSHGVSLQIGTIDPAIKVPFQEATDVTCAEVIRRCCQYQPDTVSWFDYTTNPPTIHFQRRSNLSGVTLDLAAGNFVISAEPSPRYDLRPDGIKLFIERYTTSEGSTRIWYQEQIAGNAHEGPGCIVSTIPCMSTTSNEDDFVPRTLAQDYFNSVSALQWEGSIKLAEVECSGLLRPGKMLNLANGRAAWATMAALVQSVVMDLDQGRTTVKFGPPTQLGTQDFLELARISRKTTVNNQTGRSISRTTGIIPIGNPFVQALTTFPLKACNSETGQATTVWVSGMQ